MTLPLSGVQQDCSRLTACCVVIKVTVLPKMEVCVLQQEATAGDWGRDSLFRKFSRKTFSGCCSSSISVAGIQAVCEGIEYQTFGWDQIQDKSVRASMSGKVVL